MMFEALHCLGNQKRGWKRDRRGRSNQCWTLIPIAEDDAPWTQRHSHHMKYVGIEHLELRNKRSSFEIWGCDWYSCEEKVARVHKRFSKNDERRMKERKSRMVRWLETARQSSYFWLLDISRKRPDPYSWTVDHSRRERGMKEWLCWWYIEIWPRKVRHEYANLSNEWLEKGQVGLEGLGWDEVRWKMTETNEWEMLNKETDDEWWWWRYNKQDWMVR